MTADSDIADIAQVDLVQIRASLRARIAMVKTEEHRLSAVEAGLTRSREEQWPLRSRLNDAAAVLASAVKDERLRAAYSYVNSAEPDDGDPVAVARADLAAVQAEIERLENIENALGEEARRIQDNLREHHSRTRQALAEVLINSAEFKHLCAQHRAEFQRLRSIKSVFKLIISALQGHGPQWLYDLPSLTEPLEERTGYPLDDTIVGPWRDALHALSIDASTELPSCHAAVPNNNGHALSRPNGNNNHHLRAK